MRRLLSPEIFPITFAAGRPEAGYVRGQLPGGSRLIARSFIESSRLSCPQYENSSFAQATPFSRARLSGLTAPSSNRFSSCVCRTILSRPWSSQRIWRCSDQQELHLEPFYPFREIQERGIEIFRIFQYNLQALLV